MSRKNHVNETEIPSDSESVDGLGNCDDEEEVVNSKSLADQSIPILNNISQDEESIEEDASTPDQQNPDAGHIWESISKLRTDIPFSKSFGPNIPENAKSPLEIFTCLFPTHLLDHIVEQTNLYCAQKNSQHSPITREELKIFFGINILMGIKKLPSYRDYWSDNPQMHDSYISSLMTVNRFGFFLSHMHINDNSKEPKRGDPRYDKLYKLRPLLDELSQNFKECFKPGQYQSIDESMIKFKGKSSMKQYMPAKPVKRGYKCWIRADESGYVCEFQIYTGKTDSTEKQLGARVVKDLTRELIGGNHHVYFDNFFTGVDLLLSLKQDQIFACGTVRQNRSGLPSNSKEKKTDKKMEIGEYEFKTTNTGLSWVKWMDKKPVHFLSNYHDPSEVTIVNRRQKDGSLKPVNSPVICSDYNKHMGYVDSADRLIAVYKIDRKSKKWWFRLFWHFLDLTITNAYILYKEKELNPKLPLKKFRLLLVEQLVKHKIPNPRGRKRQSHVSDISHHGKPQVSLDKRHSQAAHMPVFANESRRCAHCSTKEDQRRTKWKCMTCNVPLCLLPERNCFQRYHT